MTNYQECTMQWQMLEELLRYLKITMRTKKKFEQAELKMQHTNGTERYWAQEEYSILAGELMLDTSYYWKRRHDLDGIKIAQNQISFDEFEALLYFAEVTGEDREKWFYDFSSIYPWITSAWDKRNAA